MKKREINLDSETIDKMKNLTAQQLYDACRNHHFLILRYAKDNSIIAVNCKIARFKMFDEFKRKDSATKFISYKPCNFMEYISKKVPFYRTYK